ncbi:MAG: VCBS repeat-containing protein [Thermodesulfovibrionales bacterium]|nr:VCBS repeat-containing protein [Thermodesulfovibrionales bacterium]
MHRFLLFVIFFAAACSVRSAGPSPALTTGISPVPEGSARYLMKSYHIGPRPTDPVCADLNGDGYRDIAVALKKQALVVMLNDHSGSFSLPVNYETFPHNTSLTAADVDGDGDPDLVPLTELKVGPVFLNDGRGNFTRHDLDIQALLYSWHIESEDLNNDSLPDLVISSLPKPFLSIVMNKGNMNFTPNRMNLMPEFEEPVRKSSLTSTRDDTPSISSTKREMSAEEKSRVEKSSAKIQREDLKSVAPPSEGTQSPEKTEQIQDTSGSSSQKWRYARRIKAMDNGFKDFVIEDINGDGFPDIVAPSYVFDAIYIGLNDGKGNFDFTSVPIEPVMSHEFGYALSSIALLRYPDRKLPDVAVSSERDGKIYLFENKDGRLLQKTSIETNQKVPVRIVSDDMNGDGLPDIVVTFAAPLPVDNKSTLQIWQNSKEGFFLSDTLQAEGQGLYLNTCRLSPGALPSIVISNVHEETLNIFSSVR